MQLLDWGMLQDLSPYLADRNDVSVLSCGISQPMERAATEHKDPTQQAQWHQRCSECQWVQCALCSLHCVCFAGTQELIWQKQNCIWGSEFHMQLVLWEIQLLDLKLKSPNLNKFTVDADHKGTGSSLGYSNHERVMESFWPITWSSHPKSINVLFNSSPFLRSWRFKYVKTWLQLEIKRYFTITLEHIEGCLMMLQYLTFWHSWLPFLELCDWCTIFLSLKETYSLERKLHERLGSKLHFSSLVYDF